jgi:NADPH-dependent glutamate synthase beta subunit-like oxidoreductase/coenzyme F420-reducing hydrogenase delta subunit
MRFAEPTRRAALDAELQLPQASPELWPPCGAACPVGTMARDYLSAIAAGEYEQAFRIAREPNPIVSACAYICHHPCEEACRRGPVDEALAIRNLKRWAVERGRPAAADRARELEALRAPATGKSVAIVGGGPAGMAAAEKLAQAGHSVTVFERRAAAGGQLVNTIPLYRLPRAAVAADVADLAAMGVEFRTGVEIGADMPFAQLRADYDAVVLAIGLSLSRSLPIEGAESDAVWLALPFLEACATIEATAAAEAAPGAEAADLKARFAGRRVIVVGGGNVAIDVARSAMRLGPASVTMVCLESEEEMPAWPWEIQEAAEEGVSMRCSKGPKRIVVEEGRCKGLETKGVKCVFDEQGRFAPEYHEDQVEMIEGDTVILAIGQMADWTALAPAAAQGEGGSGGATAPAQAAADLPKVDERGRLEFDPAEMTTSAAGVFACGEVVTGPGAAIEAAASGQRAAAAVMGYLATGRSTPVPGAERPTLDELPDGVAKLVVAAKREPMPSAEPGTRKWDFSLFESGYDERAALAESRRCLLCDAGALDRTDLCATCVTCERVCPFGVATVKGAGWMPALTCQACGVCVVECPAGSITMNQVDPFEGQHAVEGVMAGAGAPELLIIACDHHRQSAEAPRGYPEGVVEARIGCAGRVRVDDVLLGYERGAQRVLVSVCDDGGANVGAIPECRNRGAGFRAEQRLSLVRNLLAQAGLDPATFRVVREGARPDGVAPETIDEMLAPKRVASEAAGDSS